MRIYVDRFKVGVARYTVRARPVRNSTDSPLRILLIQNANMSPDILNSVAFQISSCPEPHSELFLDVCHKDLEAVLTAYERLCLIANTDESSDSNNEVARISNLLVK